MSNRRLWIWLTLAAVLLVAGTIFFFSSQSSDDSSELSNAIIEPPLTLFEPEYPTMPPAQKASLLADVSFVVRKLAHFSIFALLGFCLMAHVTLVRWGKSRRVSGAIAWLAAVLYACSDELHQMYAIGRSPELRDVCIDSGGALCGILLMAACSALAIKKRRQT